MWQFTYFQGSGEAIVCGLFVACLCVPVGCAFGGLGCLCRHKGPGDGRVVLTIVCALLMAAGLSPRLLNVTERRRRIVARFPAVDVYGVPVAFGTLADPTEFIWAAVPQNGRSIDLFKGSLSGDVEADGQLAAPEFIGSLKSPQACFDASATFVAAATPRGVVVWDHRTAEVVWSIGASKPVRVTAVALSPTAPYLAYATPDPVSVHLVALEEPFASATFVPRATAPVCCFCFGHGGKLLVAGTGDPSRQDRTIGGEIAVIDLQQRELKSVIDVRVKYDKRLPQFAPHDVGITSIAVHPGEPWGDLAAPTVLATMNRVESEVSCWQLDGTCYATGLWSRLLRTACHYSADSGGSALGDAGGWVYVHTTMSIDCLPDEALMKLVGRSCQPVELLRFLPDCNHLVANELLLSVRDITKWYEEDSQGGKAVGQHRDGPFGGQITTGDESVGPKRAPIAGSIGETTDVSSAQKPYDYETWTNPKDGSEMVFCPAGTFKMGGCVYESEKPIHEVTVGSFYIGKLEVTNHQFKKFVDANPQWGKGRVDEDLVSVNYLGHWQDDTYPWDKAPWGKADHPVINVSWFAAKAYCEWAGGRLPTEAEWEYASRAGTATKYCFGESYAQLEDYAWFQWNSGGKTHPVGQKKPNRWGIHDTHGNVFEWCSSKQFPYPYRADDGREDLDDDGANRVLHGGSWYNEVSLSRPAYRASHKPSICGNATGFRVCVTAEVPE